MNKIALLTFLSLGIGVVANAQEAANRPPATPGQAVPATLKAAPKPYKDIITAKAKTTVGLFTVHKIEDKVYFEIADSILNRDILIVSRLAKAGADMRNTTAMTGYAGDELNQTVVRFEQGPNNKLFIRELSYSERSKDSTQAMFKAVSNSNVQPIALAFDVKAYKKDSLTHRQTAVIDMTDIINGDNDLFFFGSAKGKFGVGAYQADKSYLLDVKTFPINTEIKTVKTYFRAMGNAMQSTNGVAAPVPQGTPKPVTVELNTSIVLLPQIPMQARYADDRVGYFSSDYTDFDINQQGIKRVSVIERWRLEPKDADIEKYKKGELVEPKKPIVIYIDPETPAKWVPYLIQGINDWRAAFERAGFKNAIIGKTAPTPQEDPNWSLDDARNSALVYKPSSIPNASGPHITDPRSGEVIETHINWYHNIMKLVHDWYFVQAGAIDPKARKMQFDDELMGQLIRFVSSHEVGHTLGLLHNFGSSSSTPVEKLRDKAWVEANGHTPSIMDYARFNYVAQPEDNISEIGIFPRIGEYDKWAIEWGYKLIPEAKNADQEIPILNKWIIAKSADRRYWFGSENNTEDPRMQSEDIGDNAMKASDYGIKNLKRIMLHLPEWTRQDNESYEELQNMHEQVFNQFSRYIGHVLKNVGGRYVDSKSVEQAGAVYSVVPAATQKEAMDFLNRQVFTPPLWVVDKRILDYTGSSPIEIITSLQESALVRLFNGTRINRMLAAEAMDPTTYKVTDMFNDLDKYIWTELVTKKPISIYRRNLQRSHLDKICAIVKPATTLVIRGSDLNSIAKAELIHLRVKIRRALPAIHDTQTRDHLNDMLGKIDAALTIKG
ncbi:hypothetical protein BEL04_11150 [Mucilaginibacter sp. PPCGB 2223]|uniref:zinc-dependent metalloprotease n=1 Tax=Mucilaginibacter sp. PPCGB 2223 TaxID=1886027 RepID=UPI0008262491|nr:zinc-dependent metalloprotease [Mucilaginibacter sp. PPCGB 2223]OCX52055.1 hypothetical protein BEL04_11150 [Mucilaginibacter sp. PPCGB 2223]